MDSYRAVAIIPFIPRHGRTVASLHEQSISSGFISKLGNVFLRLLYRAINRSAFSRVFIAIDDKSDRMLGFIAGSLDTRKMYRHIICIYGMPFFLLLLPQVFKRGNLKRILETLFYSTKIRQAHTGRVRYAGSIKNVRHYTGRAELLAIAVDKDARGQKIGKRLIDVLEAYFNDNDIQEYKVVTFSEDANTNAFYRACGFIKRTEFFHHGNLMFEYSKTITCNEPP